MANRTDTIVKAFVATSKAHGEAAKTAFPLAVAFAIRTGRLNYVTMIDTECNAGDQYAFRMFLDKVNKNAVKTLYGSDSAEDKSLRESLALMDGYNPATGELQMFRKPQDKPIELNKSAASGTFRTYVTSKGKDDDDTAALLMPLVDMSINAVRNASNRAFSTTDTLIRDIKRIAEQETDLAKAKAIALELNAVIRRHYPEKAMTEPAVVQLVKNAEISRRAEETVKATKAALDSEVSKLVDGVSEEKAPPVTEKAERKPRASSVAKPNASGQQQAAA